MREINSDEDLMKTCVAAMMAAEQNDVFKGSLLAAYDAIILAEETGDHSTKKLREQILSTLTNRMEELPMAIPEDIDMKDMSKCCTAVLWCYRTIDYVEDTLGVLSTMANLHEFFLEVEESRFQDDHR
jgi:hypothetical protein